MHKRLIAILAGICMIFLLCPNIAGADTSLVSAPLTPGATQNGMVRVRLSSLGNISTFNLTILGSYSVNGMSDRTLSSGAAVTVKFNASSGQWTFTHGGVSTAMGASFRLCRHETSGQNGIRIAQGREPGNLYPGDFQFVAQQSGGAYQPYVIAHIYMEDYLYGVLPYEMGDSSGLEALKAQAVAARTYTMRAMANHLSSLYDVVDTTADQVYSGTPQGNANCVAAVNATKGIVAQNGPTFTGTYYTASNGGQTESIENAWGTKGYSYLGVKDDPYDLANPDSRTASFTVSAYGTQSSAALNNLLRNKAAQQFGAGASITAVLDVTAHSPKYPAPSRLYTKLDFSVRYSLNGETHTGVLTFDIFKELENALGMNISSTACELWSVSETDGGFLVVARRYGHGIGMSQRGAMYMAKLGFSYDQILAFYYEGCSRVQYTLTRSILSPVAPGQASSEQWIAEAPAAIEDVPAPESASALTARVNTSESGLNLRAAASASSSILGVIPRNAQIPVWEITGGWCKTTYQGRTGYVSAAYLLFDDDVNASPQETQVPSMGSYRSARVATDQGSLNLRAEPNANAQILRTIPQDAVIPVLEETNGIFCKTVYENVTGYVMRSFLAFLDEEAPAEETPDTVQTSARVSTPGGSLNLREKKKANARVLLTIPENALVTVLEKGDTWCFVTYQEKTGYVKTEFLLFDPADKSASALVRESEGQVPSPGELRTLANPVLGLIASEASSLNLRSFCSLDAPIITEMPRGDYLVILAVGDTWCEVEYEDMHGYCMRQYLEYTLYE
ncbi:MAG: SpoIID/LytB domain-containing protein [Clostridia bacterium]|nr:SpoIID/LytB domain-containing protein [Clostridia bacterium]